MHSFRIATMRSPRCRGGAIVGTSSLRRQAALKSRHPHLRIEPLRGNVGTRLRKLDEGHYDAIILAAAGLIRLGLENRITARLAIDDSLPAVGQGALGIEIADDRDDVRSAIAPLHDADAGDCTRAEREFARQLIRQLPHAARGACADRRR